MKSTKWVLIAALVVALAIAVSACGGAAGPSTGGGGQASGGTIKIVSSLPEQGGAKSQTDTMINALQQALDDHGAKSGNYTIVFQHLDDSSAALGKWDPAVETANANKAAADPQILAYIGTYNSGAAKLSIPILGAAGPLVMVSPANTYPGLTKKAGAEQGEPEKYYPSGVRNYARVVPADDIQGAVGARWYQSLGFKSVYILDDQELYGKGVADIFETEAKKLGINVLGHEGIDTKATDYSALATKIVQVKPDAVYFGGIESNHPGLVLKALHAAGFKGQYGGPDGMATVAYVKEAGADAEGTIGTFGGLPPKEVAKASPEGQKWYDAYKAKFKGEPENYATYSYETMLVVLKAIDTCVSKNDVTRKCVRDAVFATKDFKGILGATWSFDASGDTTLSTMSGQKVVNGEYQFVSVLK